MARIRTIKPEFFTSEDIVALSPFARLLYIALWCEADRDGRMSWRPRTFKIRYLPADDVQIEPLCEELLALGLVVLYRDGEYAYIPKFAMHQHINPRESASTLPDPHASSRVSDASSRAQPPSVTRREEGKGQEVEDASRDDASPSAPPPPADGVTRQPAGKGGRLPRDWQLPQPWADWARAEKPQWSDRDVRAVADRFRDHWIAKTGRDATKSDWEATWRNWVRREQDVTRPTAPAGNDRSAMFRGAI